MDIYHLMKQGYPIVLVVSYFLYALRNPKFQRPAVAGGIVGAVALIWMALTVFWGMNVQHVASRTIWSDLTSNLLTGVLIISAFVFAFYANRNRKP